MRMKRIYALLAAALAVTMLTGCDGQNTASETDSAETAAPTEEMTTDPPIPEFTVEPNAIEGLTLVERIIPLGNQYVMIGLNEFDGRSVVLYNAKTKETTPKTLKRLSEAGDILEVVTDAEDNLYVFYTYGENGEERYVETYDAQLNLVSEMAVEDMTEETVDFATMEIDKNGYRYFLGWDEGGNHEVWIYDKEMQFLGTASGEMTVGDELISAADGKVYLMYHVGAQERRFAWIDPKALTLNEVQTKNMPVYYNEILCGTNGYDFYFNAHEALYGIHAAEGRAVVVIDWTSTVFDGNEIRGVYPMSDNEYLVGNVGGNIMDAGTWKMVAKE